MTMPILTSMSAGSSPTESPALSYGNWTDVPVTIKSQLPRKAAIGGQRISSERHLDGVIS